MTVIPESRVPRLLAPGDAETRYLGPHRMDWLVLGADTGEALTAAETIVPAGAEPPLHVHAHEDELFYVLDGEVTFTCGDEQRRGGPGTVAWLPRGVPHGFRVESPEARLLVVFSPAGAERFFRAAGAPAGEIPAPLDHAAVEAGLAGVGITVVGPPPGR